MSDTPAQPARHTLPASAAASVDSAVRLIAGEITDEQSKAAAERVALLRTRQAGVSNDELANQLIRQKCIETGTVGFATSIPALIPGIGSMLAVGAGLMVDIRKTMVLQKDLTLELAAVYGRTLSEADRRNLLLLVGGVDSGNKLAAKAGTEVATKLTAKLTARLGSETLVKALPVAGLVTSAAINVVSTYLVGRRAQAYLRADPALGEEWDTALRTLSGVDERELTRWLLDALEQAQGGIATSAQRAGGAVGGALGAAGRTTGALLAGGRERWLRRKQENAANSPGNSTGSVGNRAESSIEPEAKSIPISSAEPTAAAAEQKHASEAGTEPDKDIGEGI